LRASFAPLDETSAEKDTEPDGDAGLRARAYNLFIAAR
jgi:hypothetical protein